MSYYAAACNTKGTGHVLVVHVGDHGDEDSHGHVDDEDSHGHGEESHGHAEESSVRVNVHSHLPWS